jgi:antitoxin CcdA
MAAATDSAPLVRKRAVNLTLNESLVRRAKAYTPNLSQTLETLLAQFVQTQDQNRLNRQQLADGCADDWNSVYARVGSFADEHSTL